MYKKTRLLFESVSDHSHYLTIYYPDWTLSFGHGLVGSLESLTEKKGCSVIVSPTKAIQFHECRWRVLSPMFIRVTWGQDAIQRFDGLVWSRTCCVAMTKHTVLIVDLNLNGPECE